VNVFSWLNDCGTADKSDRIPPPARLHSQYGKTAFGIVIRHPYYGTCERFLIPIPFVVIPKWQHRIYGIRSVHIYKEYLQQDALERNAG
jgi:hypothetical protein